MYKLKIEDKIQTESNNVLLRKYRNARNKDNHEIYNRIFLLTRGKLPERPLTNFKLKLIRHSSRPLDYDNLVSSFKSIVDGLTKAGVIEDDKYIYSGKWEVDQVYRPKKDGPLVTIEVIESRELIRWKN